MASCRGSSRAARPSSPVRRRGATLLGGLAACVAILGEFLDASGERRGTVDVRRVVGAEPEVVVVITGSAALCDLGRPATAAACESTSRATTGSGP